MVDRLRGKTALVTAAGQGIGHAIAEAFLREGARVWATDLDAEKLQGLSGAERRRLDVLSDQDVEKLVAEAGSLDILVNAAGFVHHGTILECEERDWEFSFALNVRDAYYEAPGSSATVRVYSPITNETYTMNCRPSGSGVTCSGGNNASVTF